MKKLDILVCNHYDLAWRRRLDKPIDFHGRRFVSYAELQRWGIEQNILYCRENPRFKFNVECVAVLRRFLRSCPEYKDELMRLYADGRFYVPMAGDNIIDVNLVQGESIIRNFTEGNAWLRDNFGYEPREAVRNDAFGNCAQLPQIVRQCGGDWISGLAYSNPTGAYWHGLDGTTLYIGNLPIAGSGGSWKKYAPCPTCGGFGTLESGASCPDCGGRGIDSATAESTACINFNEAVFERADEVLLTVTSEELIKHDGVLQWAADMDGKYDVRFVTYRDLRDILDGAVSRQPDESELHAGAELNPNNTGCYVTRINLKQTVRELENRVLRFEGTAALAARGDASYTYPHAALRGIWEKLLTLISHDSVTGEHVDAVSEDFYANAGAIRAGLDGLESELFARLASPCGDRITVANLNFSDTDAAAYIEMPDDGFYEFSGADGQKLTPTRHSGRVYELPVGTLEPFRTIELTARKCASETAPDFGSAQAAGKYSNILQAELPGESRTDSVPTGERLRIENDRLLIEADGKGLLSIYDKLLGRTVSCAGEYRPAELIYEHDDGSPWATLSPDRERVAVKTTLLGVVKNSSFQAIKYSFAADERSYAISALKGDMLVVLRRGSALADFSVNVASDDYSHRLRAVFPVPCAESSVCRYGIPCGNIERPEYMPTYYWAGSNGDWPAINWAGVEADGFSAALFDRGIPSHRTESCGGGKLISLSLLRSPCIPTYLHEPCSYSMTDWDGMRDAGRRCLSFAFAAFNVPLSDASVSAAASAYCRGLTALSGVVRLPSAPRVVGGNAVISSIQLSNPDGELIIRLFETSGRPDNVKVLIPGAAQGVSKGDISGANRVPLPLADSVAAFPARPYEIATLFCGPPTI